VQDFRAVSEQRQGSSVDRLELLRERTRWQPEVGEPRAFERWERAGVFHPPADGTPDENFSIAVPPPNVTGSLHMGHALNASIQDVLVRRARMRGLRTKWVFGTDHAGIATQVKVEEALRAEGLTRHDLGRERFLERVWEWRERYGGMITRQFKRLGASLDYSDERFTMDPAYARAVLEVFVRLYEKGLIYRDRYIVNWDPGTRSAISDLEVVQKRVQDVLYLIDYPLASGSGAITVATVRPETMLADVAVAVNPNDERYERLIGETAVLPLVGRRLPIIGDERVDPEFGTGALKITPGHDPLDFEIGRDHGLEPIVVIDEEGRLTAEAGERFAGLSVDEAREAVVQALREEGRIVGAQPYEHDVPHSHRSGRRIEPRVSLQWFCNVEPLAQRAIAVVRDGTVRFHPEKWARVYLDWLENIRPWCISRQLWWGHRIPAWYCDACDETWVALEPPSRCGACDGELRQDPDVLDTWFSSALWPFAALGWPEKTPQLQAFYPTDVLSTARDIIFLWVARMVMFGLEFTGTVPFTDVVIHSVIQSPEGKRMSKSLGTGIDPLDEIERHGADALRFGLLAMSSQQDVRYSPQRVRQGAELANKLWNAARLVLLGIDPEALPDPSLATTLEDRWILSRLERTVGEVDALIDSYQLSRAALTLYDFFWAELCDWYLELAKPRLYGEGDEQRAVSGVLLYALERVLRLLHPLMPHVTEELWALMPDALREREPLLASARWPVQASELIDEHAEREMARVVDTVVELRRFREEVGAQPGTPVRAELAVAGVEELRERMARLARFEFVDSADGEEVVFELPVAGGAVRVLRSEAFDPDQARARVRSRLERLDSEIERLRNKLANEHFVARAPREVVEGERRKLSDVEAQRERIGAWVAS
jgi:valyl-tRNA synthetase